MSGPNWKLDDDMKTVTVTFPTDPPQVLKLNAAGVDAVLQGLGEFRALMQPPFEPDFALGQEVRAAPNPRWVTEADPMLGNPVLHLRDPRFGWLHYVIAKDDARTLGTYLVAQADALAPLPSSDKPN